MAIKVKRYVTSTLYVASVRAHDDLPHTICPVPIPINSLDCQPEVAYLVSHAVPRVYLVRELTPARVLQADGSPACRTTESLKSSALGSQAGLYTITRFSGLAHPAGYPWHMDGHYVPVLWALESQNHCVLADLTELLHWLLSNPGPVPLTCMSVDWLLAFETLANIFEDSYGKH
ncbi:hypothetical protein BS47DRAFT_1394081 [Hydnum rufescens UP504]|uniref:Uncharacterized protein n=1 Tax=Hydnum rufescens UP504 TaxID=1448309 RepID=A0A9P6AVC6_9AGAM|nr:hypothetical protein BS47DRAFT_1394081 [Hydnum rufescens UP504]